MSEQSTSPILAHRRSRSAELAEHLPALDGVRGLAVVMVLFCHATIMERIHPADRAVRVAAEWSWSGVDLFFVLSGFLITGILFDAKRSKHYFRNFYARRTLRIFPLYYACLVLFIIVLPMFGPSLSELFGSLDGRSLWYWLYLSNYSIPFEKIVTSHHHMLYVTWSLAIEEQYYLVWPMVVLFFPRKTLVRICLGMILGSMLLRAGLIAAHVNWNVINCFTPCRLDGLATGGLVALMLRSRSGLRWLVPFARLGLPIGIAAQVGMEVLCRAMNWERDFFSLGYLVFGYSLWCLVFGSALVLIVVEPTYGRLSRSINLAPLRFMGRYSYGIYLLHMPFVVLVEHLILPANQFPTLFGSALPGQLMFYVLVGAPTIAAAMLSYHLMEKHFLNLKHRFEAPRKHAPASKFPQMRIYRKPDQQSPIP